MFWGTLGSQQPGNPVVLPTGFAFQPLRVGAGGQVIGYSAANDGTFAARYDSFGAAVLPVGATKWVPVCTSSALPSTAQLFLSASGAYEIVISPSNSQVLYMVYGQFPGNPLHFFSLNQGAAWTQFTNWTQQAGSTNGGHAPRLYGPKGAVDAANPDCYIITMEDGNAYETTGGTTAAGAATFTNLNTKGITTGTTADVGCVCFAPTSQGTTNTGVTGGPVNTGIQTNNVYVSTMGQGLFLRTSPTGTFTKITGTPTNIWRVRSATDGTIYIMTASSTLIKLTWSSGPGSTPTFTTVTPPTLSSLVDFVLDPSSASHITVFGYTSGYQDSTNAGASWATRVLNYNPVATDTPYLNTGDTAAGILKGEMIPCLSDPSANGRIMISGFQGTFTTTYPIPASPGPMTLTTLSHGYEQLATNAVVCPPGNFAFLCHQDWGVFVSGLTKSGTNPDALSVAPVAQGWDTSQNLCSCNWVDWASSDSTFIVAAVTDDGLGTPGNAAFNTSSGANGHWTTFSASPPQGMTCVAAADHNNIVFLGNSNFYFTQNGGTSWTQITSPGGNASATSGWTQGGIAGVWKGLTVDRMLNGSSTYTFYAFHTSQGVFSSINNGTSWTALGTPSPLTYSGSPFFCCLRSVGGNLGHLFLCVSGGSPGNSFPKGFRFYRSTNSGVAWSIVGTSTAGTLGAIEDVWGWDWGAPAPGQSYPAIYIYGFYYTGSGSFSGYALGVFRSIDNCVSFQQIGPAFPSGNTDYPKGIAADKDVYGRVYWASGGSGYGVGQIVP